MVKEGLEVTVRVLGCCWRAQNIDFTSQGNGIALDTLLGLAVKNSKKLLTIGNHKAFLLPRVVLGQNPKP